MAARRLWMSALCLLAVGTAGRGDDAPPASKPFEASEATNVTLPTFELPDPVPADYVVEDFRALLALDSVLDRGWLGARGPLVLGTLREPDSRSELADQLNNLHDGRRDVLLVYASAHGITQDGDAWLLAPGADPRFASQGRYRLRHLLAQLRECRAPVKVLLLDAAGAGVDRRADILPLDAPADAAFSW